MNSTTSFLKHSKESIHKIKQSNLLLHTLPLKTNAHYPFDEMQQPHLNNTNAHHMFDEMRPNHNNTLPPKTNAHHLFDEMRPQLPTQVSTSLSLYRSTVETSPHLLTPTTFSTILTISTKHRIPLLGIQLHTHSLKFGFSSHPSLLSSLIQMYSAHGSLHHASLIFDQAEPHNLNLVVFNTMLSCLLRFNMIRKAYIFFARTMPERDSVSWTSMVAGLAQNRLPNQAIAVLRLMRSHNLVSDQFTFSAAFSACAVLSSLTAGKELHAHAARTGHTGGVHVGTAMVDMYSKCGCFEYAEKVFAKMGCRNVRSWTALMAGYGRRRQGEEAVRVFLCMERDGIKADYSALSNVVSSSADIGGLEEGVQLHCRALITGLNNFTVVSNSIITLYSKCGSIVEAGMVFEETETKDEVTWNSLIFGHAQFGKCAEAMSLFERMIGEGHKPDSFTFVGVLCACSRGGMAERGMRYIESMEKEYGVVPVLDHYTCGIDMLGRAGRLEEAVRFIKDMPMEPDFVGWSCLLSSCRVHKNGEIGRWAAEAMVELRPDDPGSYILISSIYAAEGEWEGVAEARRKMRGRKKERGCSWIKYRGEVHVFGSEGGDFRGEIEVKLEEIERRMVEEGYVHDLGSVLQNVGEEEKKRRLRYHSERLAIGFGLLFLPQGMTIRVVKNLRVCLDCHNVTKFISGMTGRDILVRDGVRFHLFKNGECSCGDFW